MDAQIEKAIAETSSELVPQIVAFLNEWQMRTRSGTEAALGEVLPTVLRLLAQRVLEVARDRACEWCAKGRPILQHNGSAWHPNRVNSTTPYWPCNSEAVRSLANGPQKGKTT